MKIAEKKHYLLNTDTELLSQLLDQLKALGIKQFDDLETKLIELKINSFEDLLNYASGPDCQLELASAIEELFDRMRLAEIKRDTIFMSSHEVGTYLANKLVGRKQEEFWTLYLDNGGQIIAEKRISQGTLDKSIAHPRDIFRWAVIYSCSAIIIVHNHPSGKLYPSPNDFKTTRRLQEASQMMNIELLDHFIVGKGKYLSMKEHEIF